ncbi:HpcH/HpaI aldolase/citrate lyase family protein [Zavarzinia compransoris]|uniref:CoA ester lyase n=1 Tax=Zavarzinia compransoris TaxID=1264899 RepID=A0A317DX06_9PROT|nr:CoA ester lyase [Zavarzinia compransoris]PWR19219.1 CoA ester lyase [Zavarzinia compransoris]
MMSTVRPRRSVLYMPGANARALDKARSLPADGLILDLEDAVSPDSKDLARTQIAEALKTGGYGFREVVVRTNGLETPWGLDDIKVLAPLGPDAILLPKVEDAATILKAEALLNEAGAPATTTIWAMMETPLGILRAAEIAAASKRLTCFVMGTSDLTKDLHSRHTPLRLPMLTSLGITMLAARAYGLSILDGVYLDLKDEEGYRASCLQGVELGFDGKTLIHPNQVEGANEVFAPSEAEIAWSRKIIDAFAAAEAEGKGVVLVDGKLIENLHVDNAKRIVALADAIAARG